MEKSYYKQYYHLEREHWWFRARLEILQAVLKKHISLPTTPRILNAGAATGASSLMLKHFGAVQSLEYDPDCAAFLQQELGEPVANESLTELPYQAGSYDLVCAFDVIEHIEDDGKAVDEMYRVLSSGGHAYVTVPMYQSLWSQHDVINHHFRRYRMDALKTLFLDRGFELTYASHFNTLLFPPIYLARKIGKLLPESERGKGSDFERFRANGITNKLLYRVFKSEIGLLERGVELPFGVSAMLIGKKV